MSKRVFLGSTSYDLVDVRAELAALLRGLGFNVVHFESPDFPVATGLHSHDVCLDAIASCEGYLLIINRRYGGLYAGSRHPQFKGLGITHAEMRLAFQLNKKLFAFVRQAVWDERAIYKGNLKAGTQIKLVHAESPRVFEMIDEVLDKHEDNWIYFVDTFRNSVGLKQQVTAVLNVEAQRTALAQSPGPAEVSPRIASFLQTLGLHQSIGQPHDRYFNLPRVFVPSYEYPAIRGLLETKHFALILGDPLIGKTYTALHLLYEYSCQGYHPIWESVRDIELTSDPLFARFRTPRFDLEQYVASHLTERNIIYIEDPWGKIEFSLPEEFTASLNSLVAKVAASPAKLILTSRTSIFNRLTDLLGTDFVITMRAELRYGGEPSSYDLSMKRQLLARYGALLFSGGQLEDALIERVISELHSPDSIREFCRRLTDSSNPEDVFKLVSESSDLAHQFAIELIRDAKPMPFGLPHRVGLALMVYAVEHSRHFWRAFIPGGKHLMSPSRHTFASLYRGLVCDWSGVPDDPLQDALDSFGDRIVSRTITDGQSQERGTRTLQFTHPIYSEGVREAVRDASVRRLMAKVLMALGEHDRCDSCGYEGPFVYTYRHRCNELAPQGPVCIKCHTWKRCAFVLEGISLAYSLDRLYSECEVIRVLRVEIGSEYISLSLLGSHLSQWTVSDLKERLSDEIEDICRLKLEQQELELTNLNTNTPDDALADLVNDQHWVLSLAKASEHNVELLGELIHKESTDIDW